MKYLMNMLLFLALAIVLCTAGVFVTNWQYWAIIGIVFGIAINAMMW